MIDLKNCSPMQLTPEAMREDPCVHAADWCVAIRANRQDFRVCVDRPASGKYPGSFGRGV